MSFRAILFAVIGLAGAGYALWRPLVGLVMLGFMYFFRPDMWGAEVTVRPTLWLTFGVAAGWLITGPQWQNMRWAWWLAALLALYTLSTLLAPMTTGDSWERLEHIAKIHVVAMLILQLCDTPRRLAAFVLSVVFGAAWFCKVTLLSWRSTGFSGDVRIDTTVGQGGGANYIAWVMASTLGFLLYQAVRGSGWRRRVAVVMTLIWLATIVATGSRGGFVATVLAAGAALLMLRQFRALAVSVVLGGAFIFIAPDEYWDRISTITTDPQKMDASALSRYQNVQAGLRIMRDYPLWGTGLETFPTVKLNYGADFAVEGIVAHNTYIQLGSEVGLPMLALFAGLTLWLMARLWSAAPPAGKDAQLVEFLRIGALSGLVATCFQMVKGDMAHTDYLWWQYAICYGAQRMAHAAPAGGLAPLRRGAEAMEATT
jgi:O-antigen ligase